MPCLINLIVYITEASEIPTNNNFVMNAVGITKSSIGEELAVHIVAFYPKDPDVKTSLQKIEPEQFVRVGGKFIFDDTNVDRSVVKFLKVCIIFFFLKKNYEKG
jgi:hypothetical protein